MKMIGFFWNLSTKNSIVKEEPWTHILFLVVEFDSIEKAQACYNSKEYQKGWDLAKHTTIRNLQIVEFLWTLDQ